MPRSFDSDDRDPVLRFTENVECPVCEEIFEGDFVDLTKSLSVSDMTEPPQGVHECPACGCEFGSVMTGWMFYSEAG